MTDDPRLPPPPPIALAVLRDHTESARATGGFLNLARLELVARYPDGTQSRPFTYDIATRSALDAVVFAVHYRPAAEGRRYVYLRTAIRPPVALRTLAPRHDGNLWEIPAGLIHPGEDPIQAAVREIREELGFEVEPSAVRELGPWMFPAPGVIGERHVFVHVEVDPRTRRVPEEDGPLEHGAEVLAVPIDRALAYCRTGEVRDGKSELLLRRLMELP